MSKNKFVTIRELNLNYFLWVLNELKGDRHETAKVLGISRRTINNWVRTLKDTGRAKEFEKASHKKLATEYVKPEESEFDVDIFPTNEERIRYKDLFPQGVKKYKLWQKQRLYD